MAPLPRLLATLCRNRKAATAVEYGLILAIIVLTIMGSLVAIGNQASTIWNNVSTKVQNAG